MFGFLSRARPKASRAGAPADEASSRRRSQLPTDLIRKIRRIEISTKRLVDQGVAGDYHSAFKGRGVEFAEVRPYTAGDEVRAIDWNVTARTGVPYVKRYIEERDLTVFLGVDVSGSLDYGSRTILKRELAAELTALLSFAAVRNQDRVGAALLSDRMEVFLPPDRRRTHVLRIVREVLMRQAAKQTDLDQALWPVLKTLKQRSVLFLISDFLDVQLGSAIKSAAARHDLILIELFDPSDHGPPAGGPVVLRDAETGRVVTVGGRRHAAEHAKARLRQRHELLRRVRQLGVDHLEIRTDRPYLGTLVRFFEMRRKRLTR
ncbi:MAG: DUF58 domain-containing protein [Acidobacteriota bacterium]